MTALHDLEVKTAEVLNAHVMALIREKILKVLGLKFSDNTGKSALIVRAFYGLKGTDASLRAHFAQCMQELGCKSCKADPDLW